ncbi:Sir2 family NAD-dependent protein deacetylase [Nocardia sp. NPDC051030]|uniref:SIR2 family NAD-dependent protein deacylase n=1 Tax=Nocardia sp. NPDC051030 TaxID=3155162 RepID=UPI003414AA9B
MTEPGIARAAELIEFADALLICTGAGMGVDSGLPDFRGTQGFWKAYPVYAHLGMRFEEMADPVHFARDPELAWGFYGHRLALYRKTVPHKGFEILRDWSANLPGGGRVLTSNVDGQFQRAGFPEDHITEVHGSIHHLQCTDPACTQKIYPADDFVPRVDESTMRAEPPFPACPTCGSPARPNILMFADWNWRPERTDTQTHHLDTWLAKTTGPGLVVIELGAGTAIATIRQTAESLAHPGTLIRINPRDPDLPPAAGVSLPMRAAAALTAISDHLS